MMLAVACSRQAYIRVKTMAALGISFTGRNQHALRATLSREAYDRWLNVFRKSMMNQMLTSYLSFGAGL
jgi:hypothetical protein